MNPEENIVIELLAHHELKEFQEFIRDHWNQDHLFAKETSVFDWQHKGPDDYNCMVAKKSGALVGIQGILPLSHFDNQLPKNQIFLAGGWKVIEDKGVGIGLRLYQSILKKYKPEFIAGTTMGPCLIPFHKWQGFEVGLMDHHVVLSPFVEEFKVAKVPEGLKPQPQKKKLSVSFRKLTEKDLDDLDTEALYLHQLPLKSDTYIKNRFMNHPVYRYDVYAVSKDNKSQALCVIRPIFREDAVVLRFVDFIGPNEAFSLMHDLVLDLLKAYNAEYLDLYSHGIPSILIQEAGFIDRRKIDGLIVPDYFEPFERKNVNVIFDYKCSRTHPAVRLFKADGDRDRPNRIQRALVRGKA